jgi:phage terminase small subunit
MTPKLIKVCNFYLEGMSVREALLKAGYSDAYASHMGSKFLNNREVQSYLREQMKLQQDYINYKHKDFFKFLKSKIEDPLVDEKQKVEYAKLLQRLGGFDKEMDIRIKELEVTKEKLKALEAAKEAPSVNTNPIIINVSKLDG